MKSNKLHTLLFTAFAAAALGFSSCSNDVGVQEEVDNMTQQTIFVYFPWSGSASDQGLYRDLCHNVDSMKAGILSNKGLGTTRLCIFMAKSISKSDLLELTYNADKAKIDTTWIEKDIEGTNYTTAEGITDLWNKVKKQAPALNYAMIIGCHGAGWLYRDDWVTYTSSRSAADNDLPLSYGPDPDHPVTRFFGSMSKANSNLMIDVETLAEGLKSALGGTKLQYIIFDACYMDNVETAYALKDVTNHMVASASEIMSAGIPYKSAWNYICSSTPNYSGIVSTFYNFYKNYSYPYGNMAAVDCRQLDKLASIMKELNASYKLSDSIPVDSLGYTDGYKPHMFFDLECYVDSLHPDDDLKSRFKTQLNTTVIAHQNTEKAFTALTYWPQPQRIYPIKHYCGLTISDPSTHDVAVNGREKTVWWKATH